MLVKWVHFPTFATREPRPPANSALAPEHLQKGQLLLPFPSDKTRAELLVPLVLFA